MDRGKEQKSGSGESRSHNNKPAGTEAIDQIANDRSVESAFQTGRAIKERNSRAAHAEIALQRQKKNRNAVVGDPQADDVNYRPQGYDPPAMEYAGLN